MNFLYRVFGRLLPATHPPQNPQRIVFIRPCCIGDVVMATAALWALRRYYPNAHITWAVGGWSKQAVENHPDVDTILDTGPAANPAGTISGLLRFAGQLRAGDYDLAVSLSRSPLMSVAVLLSGIPYRAGIDSAGRGFGYNIRSALDPTARRHEVDIYKDVVKLLGVDIDGINPEVPIEHDAIETPRTRYVVVNPSGGKNPGAQMDAKRYPPEKLAEIVNLLAVPLDIEEVVIIAGPGDDALVEELTAHLNLTYTAHVGTLTFSQIGSLAANAIVYIGNDTGLTHYAAAAGANTVMILGPTDPARYGAYNPDAISLWKPYPLPSGGFADGAPPDWNRETDGITPQDAAQQILDFCANR
ncbi:MAG: glycosyltransferase family 9 protein [Chloroflexota bacterium]